MLIWLWPNLNFHFYGKNRPSISAEDEITGNAFEDGQKRYPRCSDGHTVKTNRKTISKLELI